jgi:uncharacterized protein (TIGR00251 family)
VIPFSTRAAGVAFAVRVLPRSGRTAVAGVRGDALLVRLAAAPVDGAANEALTAFIADLFDCPRSAVSLTSGEKSRDKRVAIDGITSQRFTTTLSAILRE